MDIHPPLIPCSRTHSLAHIYLLGSQQGCISEAGSRKLKPSWGASKPKRKAYNKVVLLSDAKMPHKYDLFLQEKTGAGMCGMFKTISSEESAKRVTCFHPSPFNIFQQRYWNHWPSSKAASGRPCGGLASHSPRKSTGSNGSMIKTCKDVPEKPHLKTSTQHHLKKRNGDNIQKARLYCTSSPDELQLQHLHI